MSFNKKLFSLDKIMISIIVHCYNVEKYIDRCLNSLVSQTVGLDKLEIILINDASTDDTLSHLKNWESLYPNNILVITYETNLRQGGARNIGLSYANGEYIGFVDSDDWIEPTMYELLLKGIESTGCELSRCKYSRDTGDNHTVSSLNIEPGSIDHDFNVVNCMESGGLYYMPTLQATKPNEKYGGIYTMLFRRDVVFDHNISFPEHIGYEDNYWLGLTQLYVSRMCVLNKALYHYYVNEESTTMKKNDIRQLDRLDIEVALLDEYKKRGAFEAFYIRIMSDFIQRYYLNTYHILFTRFASIPDIYQEIHDTVFKYFPDWQEQFNSNNANIIRNSNMLKILATKDNCTVKEILIAYMTDNGYTT